jgi:hypothetical protein
MKAAFMDTLEEGGSRTGTRHQPLRTHPCSICCTLVETLKTGTPRVADTLKQASARKQEPSTGKHGWRPPVLSVGRGPMR